MNKKTPCRKCEAIDGYATLTVPAFIISLLLFFPTVFAVIPTLFTIVDFLSLEFLVLIYCLLVGSAVIGYALIAGPIFAVLRDAQFSKHPACAAAIRRAYSQAFPY